MSLFLLSFFFNFSFFVQFPDEFVLMKKSVAATFFRNSSSPNVEFVCLFVGFAPNLTGSERKKKVKISEDTFGLFSPLV